MINKGRIADPNVEAEFEHLIARLRGFLSQSFDEDAQLIVADPNLAITPVGGMIQFAGTTAPTGWRLCDGSPASRTTYKSLFDVIGTAYGAGDGSTTFNLPDMRGRFPLGKATGGTGNTLGATGGAIDHTHTGGAHTHSTPAHSHAVTGGTTNDGAHSHTVDSHTHTAPAHTHTYSGSTGEPVTDFVGANVAVAAGGGHTHTYSGTTDSGGGSATTAATPGTTSAGSHSHTLDSAATDTSGGGTTGSASGTTGAENPPFAVC
jgi:microcystin-dependent protein